MNLQRKGEKKKEKEKNQFSAIPILTQFLRITWLTNVYAYMSKAGYSSFNHFFSVVLGSLRGGGKKKQRMIWLASDVCITD